MSRERLDAAMVARGLSTGREHAKRSVMSGVVYVNGQKASKASQMVTETDEITVRGGAQPFVSRGGLKLQRAMEVFSIDVAGKICLDIGASTGGFTDCLLSCGAKKVYAIDVGYGQLDWKLRQDERVVVMERTNARNMEPSWFEEAAQFACMDVSFISIRLILPALLSCLQEGAEVVALIKPQFEAGREKVGKKGVVRDPAVHKEVILSIVDFARNGGYSVLGLDHSPIKGPEGNVEFLLHLLAKPGEGLDPTADEAMAQRVLQMTREFFETRQE
ncbi:MAG: TlyA family RNA methyltransferase [Christensenellales bacterium]|jgi:23S rRNA (cytidine1920-2'-O)/16S rRNA (cytidine1409-2'-O)-methyltransferase